MADNSSKNSKERLISGIQKSVDILAPTYGAAGSNVLIEEIARPFYRITNDGKLILDNIHFDDPIEEIGRKILSNSTDQAEKESGDARKTTCLLTAAILNEAKDLDENPVDVLNSLNDSIPHIFSALDSQKKEINVSEVKAVASTASENELIGSLIQEIYGQIGKDGIIEIDASNLPQTYYTVTEGVRIRQGYLGKYSETEQGKAVYKDPLILISKDKISSIDQLGEIVKKIIGAGKNELVIYAEDIDLSVASRLAMTHVQGGFKTLLIKAPTLWKDWIYEDFSKLVGATIVDSKEGKTFKNVEMKDLGTCTKIICTQDETRIIGTKDISEHIKSLEQRAITDDQQKLRISWLQTKIAIIKVGGNSDTEIAYRLKKAKDGCAAAYWALRDGIVPGGGVSLRNCIDALPNTPGGRILKNVLSAPVHQICHNAGMRYKKVEKERKFSFFKSFDEIDSMGWIVQKRIFWPGTYPVYEYAPFWKSEDMKESFGFDAKNKKVVDMWEANIVDAVTTTKNAVKNAISIAGTCLTIRDNGVLRFPKTDIDKIRETIAPLFTQSNFPVMS